MLCSDRRAGGGAACCKTVTNSRNGQWLCAFWLSKHSHLVQYAPPRPCAASQQAGYWVLHKHEHVSAGSVGGCLSADGAAAMLTVSVPRAPLHETRAVWG